LNGTAYAISRDWTFHEMFLDIVTGGKFEYYCTKWSTERICQCV
jgi:hypothetical protein